LFEVGDKETFFTADQTYSLMDVLQSMLIEIDYVKNENYLKGQGDESFLKNDAKRLRMALVKNLSNALLSETGIA